MLSSLPDRLKICAAGAAAALCFAAGSHAAPSTSRGEISAAQVLEMLDKAPRDPMARQILTAYLAGVGEAAGLLASKDGSNRCKGRLGIGDREVRAALQAASNSKSPADTPATPIIVEDMFARAGCRPGG